MHRWLLGFFGFVRFPLIFGWFQFSVLWFSLDWVPVVCFCFSMVVFGSVSFVWCCFSMVWRPLVCFGFVFARQGWFGFSFGLVSAGLISFGAEGWLGFLELACWFCFLFGLDWFRLVCLHLVRFGGLFCVCFLLVCHGLATHMHKLPVVGT